MIEEFEIDICKENQKHIRIKAICIGKTASNMIEAHRLLKEHQKYSIGKDEVILTDKLKRYIIDTDIIFLVADFEDDFAVKNILRVTDILSNSKKLFVSIFANADTSVDSINLTLKDTKEKSSLLIVENQEGMGMNKTITLKEKFTKVIDALYDLIDVEIKEICVHDTMLSSLISLNSFFEEKCELFIYMNSIQKLRLNLEEDQKFNHVLDKVSQAWVAYPFGIDKNDKSMVQINSFIELIEENIDEDAPYYLSPKPDMKADSVIVLLAVSYDV